MSRLDQSAYRENWNHQPQASRSGRAWLEQRWLSGMVATGL